MCVNVPHQDCPDTVWAGWRPRRGCPYTACPHHAAPPTVGLPGSAGRCWCRHLTWPTQQPSHQRSHRLVRREFRSSRNCPWHHSGQQQLWDHLLLPGFPFSSGQFRNPFALWEGSPGAQSALDELFFHFTVVLVSRAGQEWKGSDLS